MSFHAVIANELGLAVVADDSVDPKNRALYHEAGVTNLMQGPVYGLSTDEADLDPALVPNFHYDDIFGTVVNRFLVQAVAGIPLTVYGGGGQIRG